MLKNRKIAVVIPAHNEQMLIKKVIATIPKFVDKIIVVDDKSTDKTKMVVQQIKKINKRILFVVHNENKGVGASIVSGYKKSLEIKMDVTAVMAGDAQMNPKELKKLVTPIIYDEVEYVKGNRLIYNKAWQTIPKIRYLGNSALSLFTKIASGYWHIADSQTGYTVISNSALKKLWLDHLYPRYGFPNDILVHLNIISARIKEIPIEPIYNVGEKSGIKLWKVIPTLSWLLFSRFLWRLKRKYIIENFHPLVFFYISSILLSILNVVLLVRLIIVWANTGGIPPINALAFFFCMIMVTQFTFFAMWMDMDWNKSLQK